MSIAGGSDLGLFEVHEAADIITKAAHPDAQIIFGAVVDDQLGDEVRVTVIASGFDRWDQQAEDVIPFAREAEAVAGAEVPEPAIEPAYVFDAEAEEEEDLDIPSFLRKP